MGPLASFQSLPFINIYSSSSTKNNILEPREEEKINENHRELGLIILSAGAEWTPRERGWASGILAALPLAVTVSAPRGASPGLQGSGAPGLRCSAAREPPAPLPQLPPPPEEESSGATVQSSLCSRFPPGLQSSSIEPGGRLSSERKEGYF